MNLKLLKELKGLEEGRRLVLGNCLFFCCLFILFVF